MSIVGRDLGTNRLPSRLAYIKKMGEWDWLDGSI